MGPMEERTRAATYEDVIAVAKLLEAEGVEYALIGGYALALQGIVRLTEDVDVLVEPTLENARRWVRALAKLPDGWESRKWSSYATRMERSTTRERCGQTWWPGFGVGDCGPVNPPAKPVAPPPNVTEIPVIRAAPVISNDAGRLI